MISNHLLFIILYVLTRRHTLSWTTNQSLVGNIAEIYNFHNEIIHSRDGNVVNLSEAKSVAKLEQNIENVTETLTKKCNNQSYIEAGTIGEVYDFPLAHKKADGDNRHRNEDEGNIAVTYDHKFSLSVADNKTINAKLNNKRNSKDLQPAVTYNTSDLYNFGLENISNGHQNKNHNLLPKQNPTTSSLVKVVANINDQTQQLSTVESISALYSFSSPIVMGMFNCTYENTINITNYPTLTNGSYVYDNHTIIPPDLLGNYDYEVLYDCSKRSVPLHKRACICRLKHCISLCSNNIIEFYQDLINDSEADVDEFVNLFMMKMTLENKTVVTKNIAKDFEHIVLEEFCEASYTLSPEISEKLGWTFFENGTLLRHSDQAHLKKNEYCFELYQDNIQNQTYYLINPLNCAKKRGGLKLLQEFHYWTQVLSIPFFVLTISAYFCLPDLRNVHGKCFMTYLSCLTISYSILSYINLSQNTFDPVPCLFMGYLNHYMQLSQYTWLGIICIDTWMSFKDYTYKASYHKYAMYGYHLPLLITFLTFVMQNSKIDERLKPGISENRCGLEVNKWSASLYLYGPCLMILICCLISFIETSRIIKANDQEVYKIKELQFECPRVRYTLYLRLFLMMGLSWFLDIVSYFLNMFHMKNLSELIDYINALQGLYIFVNFIGRKRVRNIIKERFCKGFK